MGGGQHVVNKEVFEYFRINVCVLNTYISEASHNVIAALKSVRYLCTDGSSMPRKVARGRCMRATSHVILVA